MAGSCSFGFFEGLSPSPAVGDGAHEPMCEWGHGGVIRLDGFPGVAGGLGVCCRDPERREHPFALVVLVVGQRLAGPLCGTPAPDAHRYRGFPGGASSPLQ